MTEFLLWTNIIISPVAAVILLLRRSSLPSTLLLVSALFFLSGLAFVDLRTLQYPEHLYLWRKYGLFFEASVVFSCYFYTKTVFRDNSEIYKGRGFWISITVALSVLIYIFLNPIENLLFSPDFVDEQVVFLTNSGFIVYLLLMLFLVFGLVQLERTLAGLHQLQRWNIKLIVISNGLLLASFALYFSHSLLYRSINLNFLGFRSVAVFIAALLFGYIYLYPKNGVKLALSRGIAHRSFVLLIVGGYLILLGALGEGLRYLNIENAKPLFYLLLFVGSLGLAIVFLSEK
ncbi:MAG: hypothetical protein KAG12_00140, partial [Desulfuromusa sp.]|nr:hypothetical protein [Desulfuromusa sp.]